MSDKNFSKTPILDLIKKTPKDSPIPLEPIYHLSSFGLDNFSMSDRLYAWLLQMKILSPIQSEWDNQLKEIHDSYFDFIELHNLIGYEKKCIPNHYPSEEFNVWNNSIMGVIHGDVVRMSREFFFFPPAQIAGEEPQDDDLLYLYGEHMRRIERILYIFSAMNPGYSYMQGFNELATPFYYVLLKSNFDSGNLDSIEYLAFGFIQSLLTSTCITEFYTTQDNSAIIFHKLNCFAELQDRHIHNISQVIRSLNILPLFYSIRWFTLLFAQEHDLPNLLVIWDALFAHFDNLMDYAQYVSLAHMKMIENKIDPKSEPNTIQALQSISIGTERLKDLLMLSNQYYTKDHSTKNAFQKFLHL